MIRCTPEVRASCPDGRTCGPWAEFAEGSECDTFNRQMEDRLASGARTRYDKIKALGLGQMADLMIKLNQGSGIIPFCQSSEECGALPEMTGSSGEMCRNCMIGWLLGEGDV